MMLGIKKRNEIKSKEISLQAYINGIYARDALMSTVCNMFISKGTKPYKYPDEPYGQESEDDIEKEKERKRQLLLATLQTMKVNFDLEHNKNNTKNDTQGGNEQ